MATRTITVNLEARATGLVSGFRSAGQAASGFASQTTAAASAAGTSMTAAGSATGAAGRQMSTAMTQAQAAAQASRAALIAAGEAAQELATDMGMSYNASGRLVDEFGNIVTEAHAAELGLETTSDATREFASAQQHAAATAAAAQEQVAAAAEAAAQASMTGMQRFQQFSAQNRESMEEVGKTATVMGGVLVAGFGKAVHTFASFDQAMSSVRAATHESEANMALLSEAAIKAGADTAYSAEESAQAIEEMAKAGVSTTDILNGGLNGALSLAAAGALDVGEAAETAASAMTQFKLKGSDIPHIADLLAAGAGKAQGSVHDLGMALNQAGLVASQTGLTIEEATGGLAAFASAGLLGSDAGTSFKTMLQRLNPQSEEAATLISELGLSAYDSQGEFIGLSAYAGKLQGALKDMSSEQRNAAMQTLFGSDAVRAAAVLYEQGAEGVQEWINAVDDAGYAAETAAIMQDNLAGDLEKLGGAFDTVFLKAGGTGNDGLRTLVQSAEDLVDMVGRIPAPVLGAVGAIAGIGGAALVAGGAFVTLAPRVFETVGHFRNLQASAPRVTTALGRIGKAAGLAGGAFIALQIAGAVGNSMSDSASSVEQMAQAMTKAAVAGKSLDDVMSDTTFTEANSFLGAEDIDSLGEAILRIQNRNFGDTVSDWAKSLSGYKSSIHMVEESVAQVDEALAGFAGKGELDRAAAGFRNVAESAKAQGVSVEDTAKRFPDYLNKLRDMATNANVALTDQELLNWAMGETPAAMVAAAESSDETAAAIGEVGEEAEVAALSLEDIVEALFLLGTITMSSRDATAAFHESLRGMDEAIYAAATGTLGLGAVLNSTATDFDLTTEAGMAANAAFQDVAQKGMADVEAKAREGMGQGELQANLQGTYDALIRSANGMGITGANAEALARKVLGVPDNVDINSWMSDAALRMAQDSNVAVENLDGKTANVYVNTHETTFKDIVYGEERGPKPGGGVLLPGKATGGAISGPGTGTSDTAGLYALSNGEHVLTAREVQAMGGQSAVYDFRRQLIAGVKAYASGGAVVPRQYSAPPASFAASSVGATTVIEKTVKVDYTGPDIDALATAVARRLN